MEWNVLFFLNSALLGVGLAMDAFSVSLANGLNEPHMKKNKSCGIAGVFAFFQALMPMTGWICVHTIVEYFHAFEKFIPWIALILLAFIGGKMVVEGIRSRGEDVENKARLRDTDGTGNCHFHRCLISRIHHCRIWFRHGTDRIPHHRSNYLLYLHYRTGNR